MLGAELMEVATMMQSAWAWAARGCADAGKLA